MATVNEFLSGESKFVTGLNLERHAVQTGAIPGPVNVIGYGKSEEEAVGDLVDKRGGPVRKEDITYLQTDDGEYMALLE